LIKNSFIGLLPRVLIGCLTKILTLRINLETLDWDFGWELKRMGAFEKAMIRLLDADIIAG
jgi:hypothetical protein